MISVVLAIHNEEKNLARCLEAVKDFADEIVIVDGESDDQSLEIAKKYQAKVISTTNKANFHINKQMAMDAAKGDLVLQLDADEVVDSDLAAEIKEIHQNLDQQTQKAWYIPRKNFFLGSFLKKGGQYPDAVIRLYINGFARLPQKDVHEQIVVDGETGTTHGHLIHYANPTFVDYLSKFNRYTSFKAQQLLEAGLPITFFNSIKYLLGLPLYTFGLIFFRHKGFVDGIPGFVFAVMSGLHHSVAYLKLWEEYQLNQEMAQNE